MQNHVESSYCLPNTLQNDQEEETGKFISDMELSDLSETDTAKIIVQESPQVLSLVSEGGTFSDDLISISDKSEKICLENISSDSDDFSTFRTTGYNSKAEERQRQSHSSDQGQYRKHRTHRKSSPSDKHDKYYDDSGQRERAHRKKRSRSRSRKKCRRCNELGKSKAADFDRRSKRSRDRYDDFEYRRKKRKRQRRSNSPYIRRSKSPYARKSRSPYHRRSKSPYFRRSRSPHLRSKSPNLRRSRSPHFRRSKSSYFRRSRSPHLRSKSPNLRRSGSPPLRRSKSPYFRRSKSPPPKMLRRCRARNKSRRSRRMNNDQVYSFISDDSMNSPIQEKTKKPRRFTSQERVGRIPVNHDSAVESPTSDTRSIIAPNNEARNQNIMPENFNTNAIQASANASEKARSTNNSELSIPQSTTEPYLKEGEPMVPAVTPAQSSSLLLPHHPSQAGTSLATKPAGLPVQVNLNQDSIPYHMNVDSNGNPFPENPAEELSPNEISIQNPTVPANIIPSASYPTPKGESTFSGSIGKPMIPCFTTTKHSKSILVSEPPSYSLPEDQEPDSNKEVDDGKQLKARDEMFDADVIDVSNDSVSIEEEPKKKSPIMIDINSDSDSYVPSVECLESPERNNDVTSNNPAINRFSEPETSDDEGALQIVCETPKQSPQPDEPETKDESPYKYKIDESLIKRVQKEIERMKKERFRPYPLGSLILFEPLREPPKKDDPFESPLTRNRFELPFVKYGAVDVSPNPKDPNSIAFRFQSTGAYRKEREKRKKKKKESPNSKTKNIATASVGIQCDLTSQVILKLNLKISQLKDVINRLELMNITAAVKREPKPEKE